jgi:flagellar basal-body rod protein FlgB
MLDQLLNSGAIQTLELTTQFAARRHEILAHNIANLSTPNFRMRDVSTTGFQQSLGEAIDRRRREFGGGGPLRFEGTREVEVTKQGLRLNPGTPSGNILFHDRNDRDLERSMQALVENLAVFRIATDLLKSRIDVLNASIRETV